jgi:hypothetical protein
MQLLWVFQIIELSCSLGQTSKGLTKPIEKYGNI